MSKKKEASYTCRPGIFNYPPHGFVKSVERLSEVSNMVAGVTMAAGGWAGPAAAFRCKNDASVSGMEPGKTAASAKHTDPEKSESSLLSGNGLESLQIRFRHLAVLTVR